MECIYDKKSRILKIIERDEHGKGTDTIYTRDKKGRVTHIVNTNTQGVRYMSAKYNYI